MKRLLSSVMVLLILIALGIPAFATFGFNRPGDRSVSYGGVTSIPEYEVTIHRYSNGAGGEKLVLNPYSVDVSADGRTSWVQSNDKTLAVICRPVWIENNCTCALAVSVKNVVATPTPSVYVVQKPLTKATATRQVFLYLAAVDGGENANQPEDDDITFPDYGTGKASNVQLITNSLNTKKKQLLRLPTTSNAGTPTWGAVKICGNASAKFTNPNVQWRETDTVDVAYVLDIQYTR